MISAARNVSRSYKLPGRETVQGPLLDKKFENHIKNQCENLLNGSYILDIISKVMVQQSNTHPSLISSIGRVTYLCQSKILWTV